MTRELTPWEKLDGIKHSLNFIGNSLDSIIEGAVEWERSRIIKLLEGDAGQQIMCLDCSKELITLIKGEK